MKTRLVFPLVVFLFAACVSPYGVVKITFDDYKNNKIIQLTQRYHTREMQSDAGAVEMTFVRLIQSDNREDTGVYVKMNKSASAFEIQEEGFVKVDGQKFSIQIQNRRENILTRTDPVIQNQTLQDTTGTRTIQVVTGVNTVNWKEEHFYWSISPELAEAIKRSKTLEFRYYIGPNPVTLLAKPANLEKIRQWLKA